jgi:hypothetical protein
VNQNNGGRSSVLRRGGEETANVKEVFRFHAVEEGPYTQRIEENGVKADTARPDDVEAVKIAHINRFIRRDTGSLQGPMKDARIGLFKAHDVRIYDDAKVLCQTHFIEQGLESPIGVRDDA